MLCLGGSKLKRKIKIFTQDVINLQQEPELFSPFILELTTFCYLAQKSLKSVTKRVTSCSQEYGCQRKHLQEKSQEPKLPAIISQPLPQFRKLNAVNAVS